MGDIKIGTLCSGSKGNCTLVKYRDTAILVDAGRSTKYIKGALASVGLAPEDISAILSFAGGAGTDRGTGGMEAKLTAAEMVTENGIPMFIMNGSDPEILYELLDGKHVGTYFIAKK